MAFCTGCGAALTGAFCTNCGTRAAPAAMAPNGVAAAPARRRTSPIVWVLIVVLGFCAIGIIGMVGTGLFLARRGSGYALAKLIASANPNAEVVRTDDDSRTITIRNRRTGKVVTLSFDDARHGRLRLETEEENGKRAEVEFGGLAALPSWVPAYPGSSPRVTLAARGESDDGSGEGGNFTFSTSDPVSRVRSFYEDQARQLGMNVEVKTDAAEGTVLVMKDDDDQRSLTVVMGTSGGGTVVNVSYGRKR